MSAGLALAPSPHDRLDPVAAAVRWWTSRLAEALGAGRRTRTTPEEVEQPGRRRLARSIAIALPPEEIFLSRIALPPGGPEAHRKALTLRLAELAPLDPATLEVGASRVAPEPGADAAETASVYLVAMARAERLAALEAAARLRGARSVVFLADAGDGVPLRTAAARRMSARAAAADMGLTLAFAAAAVLAVVSATRALERESEALLAADQSMRRAAVAEERAAREAELAAGLVARGVLDRRAGAALDDLAALDAATPDTAWWTRAGWTPDEVTIAGSSAEAAAAIAALSAAAPGWSVALAGPVRAGAGEGVQTFELRAARRREAGDAR